MLYTHNEGRRTTFLYKKNICVFLFFQKWTNFCCVWEIQTEGDRGKLLYWPITFLLLMSIERSSASRSQETQPESLWTTAQEGAFSNCKLALTHTAPNRLQLLGPSLGICLYYFISPTTSDKLRGWFCLATQVRSILSISDWRPSQVSISNNRSMTFSSQLTLKNYFKLFLTQAWPFNIKMHFLMD